MSYYFFDLPKNLYYWFVFIFFFYGVYFIAKIKVKIPGFTWLQFLYAMYRVIWIFYTSKEFHILTSINHALHNFVIFLVIVIIYNTSYTEDFILKSIKIIRILLISVAGISIIQIFFPSFMNAIYLLKHYTYTIYTVRRISFLGFLDLNEFGLSFIPLMSVFIGYNFYKNDKYFFAFILTGIITAISNTRYVIVGYIILLSQLLFLYQKSFVKKIRTILIVFIVIIVAVSFLDIIGYNLSKFYYARLLHEGSIYDTSRYRALETFSLFFEKNMFFGTGVRITSDIREASREIGSSQIHVGYLSHLISYGLIGSILLFSFWFFLVRKLYLNAKETGYWGSLTALLIFLWGQATLVQMTIFFVGLVYALIFDKYIQDKAVNKSKSKRFF